jgi:predicted dehydrogenase
MSAPTRRRFLKDAALGLTAATLLASSKTKVQAASASERVRIGVIGCGNQGTNHLRSLATLKDAEIVYACDVDEKRLADGKKLADGAQGVTDLRRILDDRSVDAVTIATPDHWHVPAALLALDALKHVYVEKPCCHNVREGQLLRAAAGQHKQVVAHGTQSRSSPAIRQAIAMLRDGVIGDVLIAKCWNWQMRKDIGHREPGPPPPGVDYDTWVGPAEWMPFQANRFHYDWHWWYNFGCGDWNDYIHGRRARGWAKRNRRDLGRRRQVLLRRRPAVPDTQQVTFEYAGDGKAGSRRMLIYEQRLWSTTYPYNVDSGAEFFGTKGRMFLSKRGKFEVFGERDKPLDVKLDSAPQSHVAENLKNWLDCIQSGGEPHANIENAVRTATAVHLGNIATRLQRTLHFDPVEERILGDDEATAVRCRHRADGHWGIPDARGCVASPERQAKGVVNACTDNHASASRGQGRPGIA